MSNTIDNNNKLFEIKDLICRYTKDRKVLHVSDLIIERSRITAILGLSGIGKSTILETLGLMNKTILEDSNVLFYPSNDSRPLNYAELWYKSKEKVRSEVRKEHFSFIFQESNLMHNFTAIDNVCITLMLQNVSKEKARAKIMKHIMDMELETKVSDATMIYNLSGGERQRLAFIRAVAPEFTVLFGDEPTGNLDFINASRVLKNLSKVIKENNKSAIIVTHDVMLSVKYADDIILISEMKEVTNGSSYSYGYISDSNVYKSSQINGKKMWKNHVSSDWQDCNWMTDEISRIVKNEIKTDV